jgi:hypothetical protein
MFHFTFFDLIWKSWKLMKWNKIIGNE